MRKLLAFVLITGVCAAADKFETMTVQQQSVGTIVGTNGEVAGSGFIVGTPRRILTCDHVVRNQASFNFNYVAASGHHMPAAVETLLPRYDLAVLRLDGTNDAPALPYGDMRRIRPGDQIVYIGFNVLGRGLKVALAKVSAIGVAENDGVSVDFLEFEGEGIPGYSGGPVLNVKGEVVALMREAWNKRGVRGGNEVLVNRAFAIEPAMLSKEIFYPASGTPIPQHTNSTNTITIQLNGK